MSERRWTLAEFEKAWNKSIKNGATCVKGFLLFNEIIALLKELLELNESDGETLIRCLTNSQEYVRDMIERANMQTQIEELHQRIKALEAERDLLADQKKLLRDAIVREMIWREKNHFYYYLKDHLGEALLQADEIARKK